MFCDYWGSQLIGVEQWEVNMKLFSCCFDFLFFVFDGDVVVGLVVVEVNEGDFELQGFCGSYIGLVGVLSVWCCCGVVFVFLVVSLWVVCDVGLECVVFDVDSDSLIGVFGFYIGMGFIQVSVFCVQVKEF